MMETFFAYGSEILAWVIIFGGLIYMTLKKIAPLTETKKDDEILEKLESIVNTIKPWLEKVNFDAEEVIKAKKTKKKTEE